EAAVVVLELLVDRRAAVRGVLRLRQARVDELVHAEAKAVVLRELPARVRVRVRHLRRQAVELRPPAREPQVPEHVVERPVLHHPADEVVDRAEPPAPVVALALPPPAPLLRVRAHTPSPSAGSSPVNSEPPPRRGSTQTLPSIRFTSSRTM